MVQKYQISELSNVDQPFTNYILSSKHAPYHSHDSY